MLLLFISFIKSNQCNIMTVIKNKRRYLQGRTQKNFDPRILVQHAFSNTSIWASNQKLFRPLDKIPRLQKNSLSSYKFASFSFFVVLFKSMWNAIAIIFEKSNSIPMSYYSQNLFPILLVFTSSCPSRSLPCLLGLSLPLTSPYLSLLVSRV